MNDKPLVSIILCFYNEEKFLNESVKSVLEQDYSNWELLLVDDGSTDGSVSIAKTYAENHAGKIFYLDHPEHSNKGLSASRNAGIKKANGKFISFIDADDVWLSQKLSHQLNIFVNNPQVNVVLEASLYWYRWTDTPRPDVLIPVGVKEGIYSPPQLMVALYPLGEGAAPCPSGIMIRQSVTERCIFEESFRGIYQMYEDQAFLCKVYLHDVVFVSSACHNKYRQRPASLVSSVNESGKYHIVRGYYLQWFSSYLKTQASPRRVRNLLRKALVPYVQPFWYKIKSNYLRLAKGYAAKCMVKLGLISYTKV